MRLKRIAPAALLAIFIAAALGPSARAAADHWTNGIGTGIRGLNVSGDVGFGSQNLPPILLELDITSSDVQEYTDSAFGFGGFASKGKWTILYSAGYLKLEGSESGETQGGTPVAAVLTFETNAAEVAASYHFATTGKHAWGVLGGVNYTKHKYDFGLDVGTASADRSIDNDWTDLLIGLTHAYPISDKWVWANRLDGGFGGSEGASHFKTAFNWQVAKSWNLSFFGDFKSVEYENESPGHDEWYLYDADESGLGFAFAYIF